MPHSSSCQPPVKKQLLTFLVVFLALGAVTLSVHGHGEAKGIVLERHTLMNAIKKANKTISGMVRGSADGTDTRREYGLGYDYETLSL